MLPCNASTTEVKILNFCFFIHGAKSPIQAYYVLHVQISLCLQPPISLRNGEIYLLHRFFMTHKFLKFFELRWYSRQGWILSWERGFTLNIFFRHAFQPPNRLCDWSSMRSQLQRRGMVVSSNPFCPCQSISTSAFLCASAHPQSKLRNYWREFTGNCSKLYLSSPNSKNSIFYICTTCQSHYEQPLGKAVTKTNEVSGNINYVFKTQAGPLVSDKCPECASNLHVSQQNFS